MQTVTYSTACEGQSCDSTPDRPPSCGFAARPRLVKIPSLLLPRCRRRVLSKTEPPRERVVPPPTTSKWNTSTLAGTLEGKGSLFKQKPHQGDIVPKVRMLPSSSGICSVFPTVCEGQPLRFTTPSWRAFLSCCREATIQNDGVAAPGNPAAAGGGSAAENTSTRGADTTVGKRIVARAICFG